MAGDWGASHNTIKIGCFYDGIEVSSDGSKARITDPRVEISRGDNIIDTTNKLTVSGGAVTDDSWSNLSLSGSGTKRIKTVSATWCTLNYGATSTHDFTASLSGVDYAGQTLSNTYTVTYPARTFALPAGITGWAITRNSDTSFAMSWVISPTTAAPITNVVVERSEDGVTYAVVATLGAVTSWTDSGTVANKRYYWRIKTTNSAGASAYVTSGQYGTSPTAPTALTNTYVSDTQVNIAWTNNSAVITNNILERADRTGAWIGIATLPATTNSYQDYSIALDNRYTYRVRAVNLGIYSGYASAATTIATTPKAPTNAVAAKNAANITITWTNNATAAGNVEIWHAANGVWDGAALSTTIPPTTATYTHTAVNTAQTHQYRVRAKSSPSNVVYSDYATTGVVTLLNPPNAPTVSLNRSVVDIALSSFVVSWVHNPTDATVQTAADVRWSKLGLNTWTTLSSTTETTRPLSSAVLANGNTYEIQVRTKGGHATYSAWSASQIVKTSAIPTVTVLGPLGTIDTNKATIEWTYFDASGTTQSAWEVVFNGTKYNGNGAATSVEIPETLTDMSTYIFTVQVWDGDGQASVVSGSNTFDTDFPEPPQPVLTGDFNSELGQVELSLNIPALGGEIDASYAQVYRQNGSDWKLIADNLQMPEYADTTVITTNAFPNPRLAEDGPSSMVGGRITAWNGLSMSLWSHPDYSFEDAVQRGVVANAAGSQTDAGVYFYIKTDAATPTNIGVDVVAGTTITVSSHVYNYMANITGVKSRIRMRFHNGSAWVGAAVSGSDTTAINDDWVRASVTGVVPVGATKVIFEVINPGAKTYAINDEIWTCLVMVQTGALTDYFDGSFTDGTDNVRWLADINNSSSIVFSSVPNEYITTIDYIPSLNEDVLYKAVTWTDVPTSRESNLIAINTEGSPWVFINGGEGFTQQARIKGNPAVETQLGREKVLHTFAGRTKPVEFIGGARTKVYSLSGDVDAFGMHEDKGSWTAFETIADLPAPLVYRDPMGRKAFVSIGDVSIKHDAKSELASIDCTLTEVDYDES